MNNLAHQLDVLLIVIKSNLHIALGLLAFLWLCQLINTLTGKRLNYLGIYPRTLHGIPGIFLHPFLHSDFGHLFFNSIPLFILINFMLIEGLPYFYHVSLCIILLSGGLTWLLGRKGIHIGASALVMGYLGYLLVNAILHPSIITIILALICLYYFAGMLLSIFPVSDRTSWEGHAFGLIAGLVTVYYFAIF